ncbi:MAG TPA: DNA repair protein RadC [Bacteroidia bacterium]
MHYNSDQPIRNWLVEERPREKLISKGRHALTDAELLAILFNTGTKGISAIQLAKNVLQLANNNLIELSRLELEKLKKIKGMGEKKAIVLISALELGNRRRMAEALERNTISSSDDAYECLAPMIADSPHEQFVVMFLNRANKVLEIKAHSSGGLTGTIVDVKLILKEAILISASGIIVAHNHPSGNLNPSKSDIDLTQKIKNAASIMEISLLDHLIVTGDRYFSFRDSGLL